ncbi:hypothetical protein TRIUR3_10887 [Triticum urartu]|uniref:Uncharacterized protein n=1 Tax=Triticum urartu TaxID=4572 RepID=M7ZV50_TRIUA|nr:hypothetical protein TRIUR3_10887 [Triticum urartu]
MEGKVSCALKLGVLPREYLVVSSGWRRCARGTGEMTMFVPLGIVILAEALAYRAFPGCSKGCGRKPHRPELGCGCFGCYTAYWSRWDGSPERDREAIHRAIEAFDEHLARKEEGKGGRRRKKRAASSKGKAKASAAVDPQLPEQGETSAAAAPVLAEVVEGGEEVVKKTVEEEEETTAACARDDVPEERRRRVWGAVAGVFNWRGWGLWGSH